MKIQINTDTNIEAGQAFTERTEAELSAALERFPHRLSRVEVHLRDESAGRSTGDDLRCLMEARIEGMEPVTVTDHAAALDDAIRGATDKLETVLTSTFERLEGQENRKTIRRGA